MLAVDERTIDLVADDRVLSAALTAAGFAVEARVWGTPLDDLGSADALVVRSTWDYTERATEFAAWLDSLVDAPFFVANPPALMRWNMHKGYLLELATAGIPTVPTELVQRFDRRGDPHLAAPDPHLTAPDLGALAAANGWTKIVVKPAISATARGAACGEASELQAHLDQLTPTGDVLVQPLIGSVGTEGELSIVVINGIVTAAVRKRAQPGEWRVQSDFGGRYERVDVTDEMSTTAIATLSTLVDVAPHFPVYARIDVVRDDGGYVLMEAELIEPDLFFGLANETVDALVDVLINAHSVRGTLES